jgi:putative peptidoglycan lipid II flippase
VWVIDRAGIDERMSTTNDNESTQRITRSDDTHELFRVEQPTQEIPRIGADRAREPSIAAAGGSMALATLFSRITGFVWKIQLAGVIGITIINDSFTLANTFPTIVYELLIGGVLTSIVVPVLVRAQKNDSDGGTLFTQRLLTMSTTLLAITSLVATLCAPLITALYVSESNTSDRQLTTQYSYLLLPAILFFGLGALMTAVLNSKNVFGPGAWAPVIANLVRIATIAIYTLLPGDLTDPTQITPTHLLVLGGGATLSVAVQAVVLIPTMSRSGVPLRARWGWDPRLGEFSGMALWVVGYVAISQIGYVVVNRVLTSADSGGVTIYANTWLLLQLPYGVLGVSLLTALMPRMSRAAADGRDADVIDDLSLGSRLSAVMLVPVTALLVALGPEIGQALFVGEASRGAGRLGEVLAVSAFGLLPYAIVMLQLRVFYALKDSRVPTLIMIVMTAVKVPLSYLCPVLLPARDVVHGLAVVNSLTFVVGMIVGEFWLRSRLGGLGTARLARTLGRITIAALVGMVVAHLAARMITSTVGEELGQLGRAWLVLVVAGVLGLATTLGLAVLLRVQELRTATARISTRFRRR